MNSHKPAYISHLLVLTALLLGACTSAQASTPEVAPPTAAPTTIPPTATPLPPTATPTPDLTATVAARATQTAAPVVAMIEAELKQYDLSTSDGYLGWMNDSATVRVDSYMEDKRQTTHPDLRVADFVFHTDLTWKTSTGLAGCGLVLRSEADLDRGKQYRVYFMRILNLPLWDIEYYKHGAFQRNVTGEVLSDGAINTEQGSTNTITVIAQGNKLAVYVSMIAPDPLEMGLEGVPARRNQT